jgi:hypothetical protein
MRSLARLPFTKLTLSLRTFYTGDCAQRDRQVAALHSLGMCDIREALLAHDVRIRGLHVLLLEKESPAVACIANDQTPGRVDGYNRCAPVFDISAQVSACTQPEKHFALPCPFTQESEIRTTVGRHSSVLSCKINRTAELLLYKPIQNIIKTASSNADSLDYRPPVSPRCFVHGHVAFPVESILLAPDIVVDAGQILVVLPMRVHANQEQ